MHKIITLYLSGPMYLGKDQASGWRSEVEEIIRRWETSSSADTPGYINGVDIRFKILNPCNRWLEKGGELEAEGSFVVQMDKMEMAKSDVFIVNATNPGWGTPMEQYIGWTSGKMIIAFSDSDFPSIWAMEHCHKMCRTHVEAANYLCNDVAKQLARVV